MTVDVDGGDTGTAEPTAEEPERSRRRVRHPVYLGLLVLMMVSTVFMAWFGFAWLRAYNNDDLDVARTRDEAARVAGAALVTVSTLDYRHVDQDLDRWINASTGALHDDFVNRRATSKTTLEQAKTTTTASVLKIAVTDLRDREGTATVIAALKVDVTPEGKQATPKYLRLQATVVRTDQGWKLSDVTPVPFTPAG
ncbi:hypothetical protein [Actinokineospora inagensis]|uniref:hypothetical protein n=1 Tax=Actinokineospora inagensis TaxID=103730 RepID=UPI0003FE80FE|nr:hypothetical protein [Actinokineospora inagensis]